MGWESEGMRENERGSPADSGSSAATGRSSSVAMRVDGFFEKKKKKKKGR